MRTTDKPLCLVGFMGAGKSTIARMLAERTRRRAIETDEIIAAREERSIPDIFRSEGESYFRKIESLVLGDLLQQPKIIISSGGGAFIQEQNRIAMLDRAIVIWLDVPLEIIVERIRGDESRPLAKDHEKMMALYAERREIYHLAHVHVNGSRAPSVVVDDVLRCLKNY